MSDDAKMTRLTTLLSKAVFAAVVAIAPTEVAAWRLDPAPPPARFLPVGDLRGGFVVA